MYVTDIQISNPTYRQSLGELSAIVSLHASEQDVNLLCAVPSQPEKKTGESRIALIREALRQLSRMPEMRTGREKLSFAPGVCPADI